MHWLKVKETEEEEKTQVLELIILKYCRLHSLCVYIVETPISISAEYLRICKHFHIYE